MLPMSAPAHNALYLSIPFCRSKCSFCNFSSGVFARPQMERYVEHLERAMAAAPELARRCGAQFDARLESVYLGGGTPSLLEPAQLTRLWAAIRRNFTVAAGAEITVEVAPGTLSDEVLAALVEGGVNRVSLGVQSFVDEEAGSSGRLHTRAITLADVARLRAAGITEISVDLIAGLPHQTASSWERSLDELISLGVSHASVYMLEVDEDSRLGRELIAGGTRYHAHHVPDEALVVELYELACGRLAEAGLGQYEISNFAAPGHQSRHNLRYWQRLPYLGFGLDAHSMLPAPRPGEINRAVRLACADEMDKLLAGSEPELEGHGLSRAATGPEVEGLQALRSGSSAAEAALHGAASGTTEVVPFAGFSEWGIAELTEVGEREAVEERYFLGLRMNCGVELLAIKEQFGLTAVDGYREVIAGFVSDGLLEIEEGWLRLTARGRLMSNVVFAGFLRD
jgi:oxygen-independent coproporphyrinogen-3 oxidase